MGNTKSFFKKLSKKSKEQLENPDGHHFLNCLKNGKTEVNIEDSNKNMDFTKEPPVQKINMENTGIERDQPLVAKQMGMLRSSMHENCHPTNAKKFEVKIEDSNQNIDFTKDPPVQKIYMEKIVIEKDFPLICKQMGMLRVLMHENCFIIGAKRFVKEMFEIAEDLRATGFDLDDKWLVNILLASLNYNDFHPLLREIEASKENLTSELLRYKILEHANKLYFCSGCQIYTPNIVCPCISYAFPITREIRDGKEVDVYHNYYL